MKSINASGKTVEDAVKAGLKELGLETYEPLEIIRKTEGRMAEDDHWIKIMEG